MTKSQMGERGNVLKEETFHYDDKGNLLAIEKRDEDGRIVEKVVFGMESHATQFLQYVMAMDSVFAGDDRFTVIHYENERIVNYQFYDVDSRLYGEMGFFYDTTGTVNEEIWIKHPEKRIVRRWTYTFIPDEDRTRVTEWDTTGTIVYDTYLAADGSEMVFTFLIKSDTLFANRPVIPYNLDVALKSGMIQWEWIGAKWDSVGTHTYHLKGHELNNIGRHELRPELVTPLVNGALYRLKFQGETSRGYPATAVTFEPVVYDITRPVVSGYTPGVTNDLVIDLSTSEPLKSIAVEIRRDESQLGYSISYSFQDSILPLKSSQLRVPVMNELIEQIPYRIFITGKDRADNYGATIDIGVFVYDKTPPGIVLLNPENYGYINLPEISYSLTESLSKGSLIVSSPGVNDNRTIELDGEYLTADKHDLNVEHSYKFRDSTYYSFRLFGADFAGNISDTVSVDSVYYDITPPEVTVIFPYDSAVINEPSMSYISNEQLSSAIMEWIHSVGTEDTIAPYYIELSGPELVSGKKIRKSLPVTTGLRDGAVYTIYLSAWDLAGNAIDRIQINNVLFDASPPELSIISPQSNTVTNSSALSYSSTEYLSNGTLYIESTGGDPDPQAPYAVELAGPELSDGYHDRVLLAGMPPLKSGTVYSFTLTGADLGANKADPVSVTHVTYDNIPPDLQVTFPAPNSINTRKVFAYTLSEDLAKGQCLLLQSGGVEDSLAPHIIPLFTGDLLAGEHTLNIDNLAINEASRYTLQVVGVDYAGNATDTIRIPDIVYDITSPEMIISLPRSRSLNIVQEIAYTLSENLDSAYAVWTRTGGTDDPNAPHRVPLTAEESRAGSHFYGTLTNQSALVSGTTYSLTFKGRDAAGHSLVVSPVADITYDFVAPVVSLIGPKSNTVTNRALLEYDLSETLAQGWIVLTRLNSDGTPDSSKSIELIPAYGIAGHHQFSLPELDETALVGNPTYTLWMTGRDAAGNSLKSDTVSHFTFDDMPPVLSIEKPLENGFINTVLISYRNSEDLASAKMVWQNEVTDENQAVVLAGDELLAGLKQDRLLQQAPTLIDGQVYALTYSGTDIAGNTAQIVEKKHITYDITKPSIIVNNLQSNDFIKSPNIFYSISEPLAEATFEWISYGTDGKENIISHSLPEAFRAAGQYELVDHYDPGLADGQTYDLHITYIDRAGNEGAEIGINRLKYDSGPPTVAVLFPGENSFTKENKLELSVSEPVKHLVLELSENGEIVSSIVLDTLIQAGNSTWEGFFNRLSFRIGVPFDFRVNATDMAGNQSAFVEVQNIMIDDIPPEITIAEPAGRSLINRLQPTIVNSEKLSEATIIISPFSGRTEFFKLREQFLEEGRHKLDEVSTEFEDNIPFSIQIFGRDMAGNESTSNKPENIRFDRKRPVVTITAPTGNTLLKSLSVEYENDENLSKAVLGLIAVDSRDTIEIDLTNDDLKTGSRILANRPEFAGVSDGIEYEIALWGMDYAGNPSDTSRVEGVRFDFTAPELSITYPASNTFIADKSFSYTLSEDMGDVSLKITGLDGIPDTVGNYTIDLDGPQLTAGEHKIPSLGSAFSAVSGGIYTFELRGADLAGNASDSVAVQNIHFDNEPPVMEVTVPLPDAIISDLTVTYSISEELIRGELIVGREGANQPAVVLELAEEELQPGEHNRPSLTEECNLAEGDILSISVKGRDRAGNEGESLPVGNIRFDNKPPVISLTEPRSNSLENKLAFSMSFSEPLAECVFEITRIDGPPDNNAPYVFSATSAELGQTVFDLYQFQDTPKLVDDVRYRITVKGTDFAGNSAAVITVDGFRLDTAAPQYSLSQPVDGEKIAREKISYMLSDDLKNGQVVFTYEGGTPDPDKRHVASLDRDSRTQGPHLDISLDFDTPLVDGAKYTISMEGADKAGNPLGGQPAGQVLFDAVPPELALMAPPSDMRLRELLFAYTVSEDLSLAKLEATAADGRSQTIELSAAERKAGEHQISVTGRLNIQEEVPYSYRLIGVDLAGNQSVSQDVANIVWDTSNPYFSVSAPEDGERLKRFLISYEISEPLDSLNVEIIRTAGEPDPNSPYYINLPDYLAVKGRLEDVDLEEYVSLQDGAEYKIVFTGKDKAGNRFPMKMVTNLVLDKTPPQITVVQPKPESFTKKKLLQFETFEPLSSGKVEWFWQSGKPDMENHTLALKEEFLAVGEKKVAEIENINFVSGANYDVKFTLTDRAGNINEYTVPNVTYDFEAPVVTAIQPLSGQRIKTEVLKFSTDEPLRICRITWVDMTSNEAHIYLIPRDKVAATEFTVNKADSKLSMVNDHVYQIRIFARDKAGNQKETLAADSVVFDVRPPMFTKITPAPNRSANSSAVSYVLNEPCQSGRLIWMRSAGPDDPLSPHIIELPRAMLKQGYNNTSSLPEKPLIDGATYAMVLSATDLLGNKSRQFNTPNIVIDRIRPVVEIISPKPGAAINKNKITITFNEPLKSGILEYVQTGGEPDPDSPRKIEIVSPAIQNPDPMGITFPKLAALNSGSIYTIIFEGTDAAGNKAKSDKVTDVLFDNSPPQLTILSPTAETVLSSGKVDILLSEDLISATLIWENETNSRRKPVTMDIPKSFLKAGEHYQVPIEPDLPFDKTSTYSLTLEGRDRAGNTGLSEAIPGIIMSASLE